LSYAGKIRLMLALLGASLLLTAIIVRSTYTPAINLAQTAKILEENLQRKEDFVNNAISTPTGYNRFRNLADDNEDGLKCLKEFTTNRNIKVITTKKNTLTYWSDIAFIPRNAAAIKEGYSFIKSVNDNGINGNGYYEAIKKSQDDFSVIFLIPVKTNYVVQNQYLQNKFAKGLLKDNNVEIADFSDKNTQAIRSVNNTYLFSVKASSNDVNFRFFYFELVIWVLALLVLCILVQNICFYLADKEYLFLSFLALTLFIVGLRFINLHYNWPNFTYRLNIFNPQLYTANVVFPSLGDLCVNILMLSWLIAYLYRQRLGLLKYVPGKLVSYIIVIGGILMLLITSTLLLNIFYSLVIKSNISFDVNNVLGLSAYSLCGILMLCFSFFIFYLLSEVLLTVCINLPVSLKTQLLLLITGILLTTIYACFYRHEFISFYILWSLIVITRGYAYHYKDGRTTTFMFAWILFICAVISSLNLNHFEGLKEKQNRKTLVKKLENPNDINADYLFKKIEHQMIDDSYIINYFNAPTHNHEYLQNRFKKLYFDDYLSKYDFKIHEFDAQGRSIPANGSYQLDVFKDLVLYSSFKVSDYFYRGNESFGFQNYFAILPVTKDDKNLGSIVIELKSKASQTFNSFPGLLMDGELRDQDDFQNYSYAFYTDNKLRAQSGNFIYKLVRDNIDYPVKTFVFKSSEIEDAAWYRPFVTYSHLIYKTTERNLIDISKEEDTVFNNITSVTFFFVIFLAFSVSVILGRWAWQRIKILTITNDKIKWGFKISLDKILYKTRIQFSMVFAVVVTLILVGIITYISISTQYQAQQDKMIRDKIIKITDAFESGLFDKYMTNITEQSQIAFDALASSYASDLVLFDSNGALLITTQPRVYEYGLISKRMDAKAFITLHDQKRSELVNDEVIGALNYKTVYAPLRNPRGEVVGYLQLPYFSNQADYDERIGSLLNIMINIYALIFIAIGFFAVIIARQITNPLSFIQQSLSTTIYGKKNEPLKWDRDDEIGAMVTEYNKMIAALEDSATRLAQSERESAWREMAKQVAHEIKNPLTPLKLGLQLLEKSWREKDPRFDQKFERFSKSFVEQIESLSSIASEFSAFAKMPDTRMERFNVFDVISQAVTIFKQMDNFNIRYRSPETPFYINADKDQLLRCFNNLLKNASEATPADRVGLLEIDSEISYKHILLSLKDNGDGIPQNMSEKIFEPNFTTKSSGTGLGLAFVKNAIENAGGKVWFTTEQGIGTTFFLSLPAAD
jgi:two-component system nitrogen regulation sensor histidine kinase NtrY